MVEGARLESVYRGDSIVGSNPTVSATALFPYIPSHPFKPAECCGFAGDSGPHLSTAIHRCVILSVGTNVGISAIWVDYLQAL